MSKKDPQPVDGKPEKDKVIFITEEEASAPSNVELKVEADVPVGLITAEGDINWNCPCLGGMAVGPCGVEFREAFSCFHYSKSEVKGSECVEKFAEMQLCMQKYPELFEEKQGKFKDETDGNIDTDATSTEETAPEAKSTEEKKEDSIEINKNIEKDTSPSGDDVEQKSVASAS